MRGNAKIKELANVWKECVTVLAGIYKKKKKKIEWFDIKDSDHTQDLNLQNI